MLNLKKTGWNSNKNRLRLKTLDHFKAHFTTSPPHSTPPGGNFPYTGLKKL
jgi:hypothetical protein